MKGEMYNEIKETYKVLWNCICFKLRFNAESLHNLPHTVSSEVNE